MTLNSRSQVVLSTAWRILLTVAPLGLVLAILAGLLPQTGTLSATSTLVARILLGLVISAVTLAMLLALLRWADHQPARWAGLTSLRTGWRLAGWGAVFWLTPAALTFGVLGLLGHPLNITAPAPEFTKSVLLLVIAVLLAEAFPEEIVFRGYVSTILSGWARGWGVILIQASLFTLFAGLLRQSWDLPDLSLFLTMGILFGYSRQMTGSVWMSIGFHTAFQTGSQLVLSHEIITFAGERSTAMLALGVIPFAVTAIIISSVGIPRFAQPGGKADQTTP